MLAPDFDAFRDAHIALRSKFGKTVEFLTYVEGAFPPGTKLDPETGRPYDPTIKAAGSGWVTQTGSANVVDRPIQGTEDTRVSTAIGELSTRGKVLILNSEDSHVASGATRFHYLDETFEIQDAFRDALGPVERYLVFGDRT